MTEQTASYRQIMKATTLFGGTQFFKIIIQIIRSKVIAVLLGPTGLGVMGLLNSTILVIGSFTNFGLRTSAVKDIAAAYSKTDSQQISIIITVFRRIVWITGLLGSSIVLVLSPWLSQLTFGNKDYTVAFIWISISLLFNQLSSGQLVLLQGMRKLVPLAKANLLGSFFGLLLTLPLYYYLGLNGIVPGIIGSALIIFCVSWFFARKIEIDVVKVSHQQTLEEGKGMLKMGLMISLSGIMTMTGTYIVQIFISQTGGVDQVGLYNAGFIIINTYVGLIFTAMGTDYYPRLSATANDNIKSCLIINQQAEIAILILAPIIGVFLVFINWVVILLYSAKFVAINNMILIAAIGMFFKAASWPIAFIFLAKGAGRLYFLNEIAANIYTLGFKIIGYMLWGLTGLGIAVMITYFFYLTQVHFVAKSKYGFSFYHSFRKIFMLQLSLALCCFLLVMILENPYSFLFGIVIILLSGYYSFKELDKRLDIKQMLLKKLSSSE